MHAVEFLKTPPPEIPPVVVISGVQQYLRHAVQSLLRKIVTEDEDTSLVTVNGDEADLKTVTDELRTLSMWGGRRLVIVDDADDFVSNHRAALEKYVDKPARKSVLLLKVKSFPKTTRIAKQVAASGLEVDCSELKGAALQKWLQDTARQTYQQTLSRDAATLLMDLIGNDLGMLDQELQKLASFAGPDATLTAEVVQKMVGGWRTETIWALVDAVRDNNLNLAIEALDQLLEAGEAPLKLLGGISYTFKKYAQAVELSHGSSLDQALRQAGIFPNVVQASQAYLRRIGRARAEQLLNRLLEVQMGLKGSSQLPERMQLEMLLMQLAGRI